MDDSTKYLIFLILTSAALSVMIYRFYKSSLDTPDIAAPMDPTTNLTKQYEFMLEKSIEVFAKMDPRLPRLTHEQAIELANEVLRATYGLSRNEAYEKTIQITAEFLLKLRKNNLQQEIIPESAISNLGWFDSFSLPILDLNLYQVPFLAILLVLIFSVFYHIFRYRKQNV